VDQSISVVHADTDQRRLEIGRLWNTVFSRELHYSEAALEESALVREANAQGRAFLAIDAKGHAVGTLSVDWWRGLDVSHREISRYQLSRFSTPFSSGSVVTARKWLILPSHRKTGAAFALVRSTLLFTATHKEIRFVVIDGGPSIVDKYRKLGFRQYAPPFSYAGGELSVPMCLVLDDHRYLAQTNAFLLPCLIDCGYSDRAGARDDWTTVINGGYRAPASGR